ncbi:MAG: putative S-layer protein [Candidatus Pacearchaeota archaeon]|jgi:hypothetical protein
MNTKILSSVLLTLILSLALVSAATYSISTSTPNTLSKTNSQASFTITNPSATTLNLSVVLPTTISDGSHTITITPNSALVFNNLGTGQSATVALTYTGDTTNFKIGNFASNIVVNAVSSTDSTDTLSQNIPLTFSNTFCKYGDNSSSDLSISEVTINNYDNSDDDSEWRPLDEVTIKVKVENAGSEKVSNVYVELGLLDSTGKSVIGSLDNLDNKKISLSTISDGKTKTAEFKFNVPVDFEEENYQLVVKAYKSGSESTICTSKSSDLGSTYYETISGTRETDEGKQVVLNNIIFSPEVTAQCGDKVQVSGEVVNIGDTDYSERVKVTMYNKELGISQEKIINDDLDQGDSITVDFEFDIPSTAKEKLYVLEFRTYYDYDQVYGIISDQIFSKSITVKGNCNVVSTQKVQITAQLDPETPEAIAGKQIIVNAKLNNPGSANNYAVSVYGNSAWSSLVSIDPQSISLTQGQSGDVSIVLNIDKEATGDKQFTIRAVSGNQTVEQNVVLSITQPESETGSALVENIKANWFIYVIVLVNVVLIVAIILVIRRMLSPRKRSSFD